MNHGLIKSINHKERLSFIYGSCLTLQLYMLCSMCRAFGYVIPYDTRATMGD